jgi:hypothetical protein
MEKKVLIYEVTLKAIMGRMLENIGCSIEVIS